MKKYIVYPLLALAGGAASFYLRLQQNRTGFEPDTHLPIPGNTYALVLPLLLLVLAVVAFVLARLLPRDPLQNAPAFSDAFFSGGFLCPLLLVAGMFAWLAAGAYSVYTGVLMGASRLELVLGVLTILAALCLFPAVVACHHQGKRLEGPVAVTSKPFNGNFLLAPVAYLVIRLVLAYREDSVNPALSAYYVELLTLVALILAFYRLSSFAFFGGKTRRFVWYDVMAVILCLTSLADGHKLSAALLYGGSALLMLGFLLLRLEALSCAAPTWHTPSNSESIVDGSQSSPEGKSQAE